MHVQNGDQPYLSATDAMCYWPETVTAVAVRRREAGSCEIAAPLGLDDLLGLVDRPAGRFATQKTKIYQDRFKSKSWMKIWPLLAPASAPLPPTHRCHHDALRRASNIDD